MLGIFSPFRWSMQLAQWAPRMKSWSLERGLSRIEGERHLKARNYVEAEKFLTQAALEADERNHTVRRVQLRLQVAEAQRKQGKLIEAEQTIRMALELTARVSNPAGYVQCLDALAEVFHDGANFPAMAAALQEGVRIEAAMPHPEPLRMARRVHRMGIARYKNGHAEEAVPALEKAVTLHENVFGSEHVDTGNLLGELGMVYRAQENYPEAERCLRRALRIHEKALGIESEEATRDLHHLAGSLEAAGDIEGAAALYERVLQMKQREVGGNMDELAQMQFGLAGMYISWSNYARARELLFEALGTFKRKKTSKLAFAHEVLAHIEECSGRFQEAVEELTRAGKVWEALGQEHVAELVRNLEHRAELLEHLRKRTEAGWLRDRVAALTGETLKPQSA